MAADLTLHRDAYDHDFCGEFKRVSRHREARDAIFNSIGCVNGRVKQIDVLVELEVWVKCNPQQT